LSVAEETEPAAKSAGDDPRRAPTIKDVARLASVDPSTVSRVLRADPNQTVREETKTRIMDAARVLNYRPNAVAQSLRTRRTDNFAVIVPTLANPGFFEVFRGIQTEAAETGKLVLLVEADAIAGGEQGLAQREELFARLVLDGRADGLIVAFATLEDRLVARLAERGLPLVLVNRRLTAIHGWVAVDDVRGAELAVEHLVGLGHERIGFVGFGQETDTSRRREEGYRKAMAAAGLRVDPRWTAADEPSKLGGRNAVNAILDATPESDRPTAIFCSSLLAALGALSAMRDRGIAVPADMSIIAFNDNEIAEDTAPPLTTVRLPNLAMGREAMRMAVRATEGLSVSDVMIDGPIEVVERESTAAPR
jgi:LacI family transcriptional regulator